MRGLYEAHLSKLECFHLIAEELAAGFTANQVGASIVWCERVACCAALLGAAAMPAVGNVGRRDACKLV